MSIDNNAIVNHTCDNISHIYNSVNTRISKSVRLTIPYKLKSTDCTVNCEFVDRDWLVVSNTNVYISPEEYTLWTDNDDYIINTYYKILD